MVPMTVEIGPLARLRIACVHFGHFQAPSHQPSSPRADAQNHAICCTKHGRRNGNVTPALSFEGVHTLEESLDRFDFILSANLKLSFARTSLGKPPCSRHFQAHRYKESHLQSASLYRAAPIIATMIRELAYGIAGLVLLAYTVDFLFSLGDDPREPPRIRPKVPLVGHLLGIMGSGPVYYSQTRSEDPSMRPY